MTTTKTDPASGICTQIMVLRYIGEAGSGARLEERLRLSACPSSDDAGDGNQTQMVPCECLAQSYDLQMML